MITINLNKARDIHRDLIRGARVPLFRQLDVDFQRALEQGSDTSAIVAQKNLLRDAPQNPAIDQALDVDQLKQSWDTSLLGPSPYTQV